MNLIFKLIKKENLHDVLALFKEAAEKIHKMNVDHWQYWKNPPLEKIEWVKEGISNNEFYFIKNNEDETVGMVRILDEDLLYWGKQIQKATYIHSLVIKEKYNGKGLGRLIIQKIEEEAKTAQIAFLRLDADRANHSLCNYYEKIGFKKVGIKETPLSVNNLYEKAL